jgi:hypothetical protein
MPDKKKRVLKPVYQFDIEGKFIYRHNDVKTASENLFISEIAILWAIKRKSFCNGQWYFSRSKELTNPQDNQNPVFSGGRKNI